MPKTNTEKVVQSKDWRQRLDVVLQEMKEEQGREVGRAPGGRHLSLSVTHLEDAIMRQGMRMKDLDQAEKGVAPDPYPQSYDKTSTVVEKTADGIKL